MKLNLRSSFSGRVSWENHRSSIPGSLRADSAAGPGEAVVYRANFVYRDETGNEIVEDAKGCRKPTYVIKRKLMLWVHHITILET
jgi:hypothetical protein